jgi:hypothetical protein
MIVSMRADKQIMISLDISDFKSSLILYCQPERRNRLMTPRITIVLLVTLFTLCDARGEPQASIDPEAGFEVVAMLEAKELNEVSGIQASEGGVFFMHNDQGSPSFYAADSEGRHLGKITIRDAKNRDWEDITRIPGESGPLLVLGDTGDSKADNKTIRLYIVAEPRPSESGSFPEEVDLLHRLKAYYPDGPRDCEAMAYDPSGQMILFLTKRDSPPRLYGLPLGEVFQDEKVELSFLGEVPTLRPPSMADLLSHKKRGQWISQPTGMDISADGRRAAVITYRSLYLFERAEHETWAEALQKAPLEFIGPPRLHDEAVTFGPEQRSVYVSTEQRPTPLYRLELW